MSEGNANPGAGDTGLPGDGDSHWTDGLTNETLKINEAFKGFKTLDDFAQSHVDMVAANEAAPKPPENVDGYSYELPEGYQISDEMMGSFKQFCMDNGISADLFSKIMDFDATRAKKTAETAAQAAEDAHDQAIDNLKKTLAEGDDGKWDELVKSNSEFFNKVAEKLEGFDAGALLGAADPSGKFQSLGENPAFFQFVNFIAASVDEDSFGSGGQMPSNSGVKKDADGTTVFTFKGM